MPDGPATIAPLPGNAGPDTARNPDTAPVADRLNTAAVRRDQAAEVSIDRLLAALPQGWLALGRCRLGGFGAAAAAQPVTLGCHVLAHPAVGVALVDAQPLATRDAEARLRHSLYASSDWRRFPGVLPILHCRITASDLRHLGTAVAHGFSGLSPLTIAGDAWVAALGRALAADPGWEVPEWLCATAAPAPVTVAPTVPPHWGWMPRLRRSGRMLAFTACAASFAFGLTLGLVGWDRAPDVAGPAGPVGTPALATPAPPAAGLAYTVPIPGPDPSAELTAGLSAAELLPVDAPLPGRPALAGPERTPATLSADRTSSTPPGVAVEGPVALVARPETPAAAPPMPTVPPPETRGVALSERPSSSQPTEELSTDRLARDTPRAQEANIAPFGSAALPGAEGRGREGPQAEAWTDVAGGGAVPGSGMPPAESPTGTNLGDTPEVTATLTGPTPGRDADAPFVSEPLAPATIPPEPAPVITDRAPAADGSATGPARFEASAADLPLPPPAMPGAAVRSARPTREAPKLAARVDRRCSDALFRWQFGEALSAADRAYLREGCATGRR